MRTIPFGKIKSYAILIHSELPHLIEGEASCFTEAFSLSTGLKSGRSNPTMYIIISQNWYFVKSFYLLFIILQKVETFAIITLNLITF